MSTQHQNLSFVYNSPSAKSMKQPNQIQQPFIKVICRIKPLLQNQISSQIQIIEQSNTIKLSEKNTKKEFVFNELVPPNFQQSYFVKNVCQNILVNKQTQQKALIFSYGVTNSGKTHTILGSIEQPGILPYLIKNLKGKIIISAMQLYNDQFFSLKSGKKLIPKQIMGLYFFDDCEKQEINDENMDTILKHYMQNRCSNTTKHNIKSSRSHAIFQIQTDNKIIGVVDLAGSQRTNKQVDKDLQTTEQTTSINKSLLILGRCIKLMKQKINNSSTIIPFRQSKLTKALMQYFDTRSKIIMIANLNQTKLMFHENVKVLEYAAVAKQIKKIPNHLMDSLVQSIHKKAALSKSALKSKSKFQHPKSVIKSVHIKNPFISHKKHRQCDCDNQISLQQYKDQINSLKNQIQQLLRKQQLQTIIAKIQTSQQQFNDYLEMADRKQQQYFKNQLENLKKCQNTLYQSKLVTDAQVNTSPDEQFFFIPESIKQKLQKQLKEILIDQLQQEKIAKRTNQETFISQSFRKIQNKQNNHPSNVRTPVKSNSNIASNIVQSGKKIWNSAINGVVSCGTSVMEYVSLSKKKNHLLPVKRKSNKEPEKMHFECQTQFLQIQKIPQKKIQTSQIQVQTFSKQLIQFGIQTQQVFQKQLPHIEQTDASQQNESNCSEVTVQDIPKVKKKPLQKRHQKKNQKSQIRGPMRFPKIEPGFTPLKRRLRSRQK